MPRPNFKNMSMPEAGFSGWVYVLDNGMGHYKIGSTARLKNRMKRLRIQLPFPVSVAYCFLDSDHVETEKTLHDIFKGKRMNGEWFALDLDDFEEIYEMAGYSGFWESRSGDLMPDPFMPAKLMPEPDAWPDIHISDEIENFFEMELLEMWESAKHQAQHLIDQMREDTFNVK